MDEAELIAYARSPPAQSHDFYALLAIDTATPAPDVHRAWRRAGLKYHPDKAGASFDPAKYELFERARDVLTHPAARAAYDNARSAAQRAAAQADLMGAERRRFKDELEAAEARARGQGQAAAAALEKRDGDAERERLREAGRRRMEERARAVADAEERGRRKEDERIAELERRLREKEEKSRRRAERKAKESGGAIPAAEKTSAEKERDAGGAAAPPATAEPAKDAEWRKLLGAQDVPFEKRPIYSYTISRLQAAAAQQREKLAAAQGTPAAPFVPRWDEVKDPEVRKYIARVPKFGAAPAANADVEMAS